MRLNRANLAQSVLVCFIKIYCNIVGRVPFLYAKNLFNPLATANLNGTLCCIKIRVYNEACQINNNRDIDSHNCRPLFIIKILSWSICIKQAIEKTRIIIIITYSSVKLLKRLFKCSFILFLLQLLKLLKKYS